MIWIIGDAMEDKEIHFTKTQTDPHSATVPVLRCCPPEKRYPGGAALVEAQVRALTEDCNVDTVFAVPSVKIRHYVDGEYFARVDYDVSPGRDSVLIDELVAQMRAMARRTPPRVIVISDYGKGVVCQPIWDEVVDIAASCRAKVIVDPAPGKLGNPDAYGGAWGLIPSERELPRSWQDPLTRLCVKRGVNGCTVRRSAVSPWIPLASHCESQYVVNEIGAGDVFVAGVAVALDEGRGWLEACRFGNYLAGLRCRLPRGEVVTPAMLRRFSRETIQQDNTPR